MSGGSDRELGTFVQAYGSWSLDASAMLLPLVGFIRAGDPRMRSTVSAIQERLTTYGLVHRYLTDDGLPRDAGAFAICSFWLAGNLALQGRHDEARLLFDRVCSFANEVGLLSEEIDPRTGEQLGNFPQAFTHVALINGAFHLQNPRSAAIDPNVRPVDINEVRSGWSRLGITNGALSASFRVGRAWRTWPDL